MTGAIGASLAGNYLDWRTAYIVGGLLGLALLLLRVSVHESGIFAATKKETHLDRGDLKLILFSRERLARYVCTILVGTPLFFCYYVLIAFSPEFAADLGIKESISVATALLYFSVGITLGDQPKFDRFFVHYSVPRKLMTRGLGVSRAILSRNVRNKSEILRRAVCASAIIVATFLLRAALNLSKHHF